MKNWMFFASELVGLKLEAIVTTGGPAARAMKRATSTIPIVIAFSGDPVGTGLVESLSRPGKNLKGLSFMSPDLGAKQVKFSSKRFLRLIALQLSGIPMIRSMRLSYRVRKRQRDHSG